MRGIDDVRADFDEIAQLVDSSESGTDRHHAFLLSLVPEQAGRVLDIGCGVGRLTWAMAVGSREVVGVDLSSGMIARARMAGQSERVVFRQGDFLNLGFDDRLFDCIVSAAALHHMPYEIALPRMAQLLRPGGRLIIQDLRRNTSLTDALCAYGALIPAVLDRFARTGRPLEPRHVRTAWARHGANETYLSLREARALAGRYLAGARVVNHWLWRYTIVWDKPSAPARR